MTIFSLGRENNIAIKKGYNRLISLFSVIVIVLFRC